MPVNNSGYVNHCRANETQTKTCQIHEQLR